MNRVEGLDKVLGNLNREVKGIEQRSMAGLIAGGHMILGEAKKPENTPRDTGNLVNSGYTRKSPEGEQLVEIGFSAAYAIFVHEDLEANHPRGGRAKFLEIPLHEKKQEVFELIRKTAAVKK